MSKAASYAFGNFNPTYRGPDGRGPVALPARGLKRDVIAAALARAPRLCKDALIDRTRDGHTCARCALAQLLSAAGITDTALQRLEDSGRGGDEAHIWLRFGPMLQERYGFLSARQVGAIMESNDNASRDDLRETFVLNEVDRMLKSGWR